MTRDSQHLRILHVLTLNGRNGEYGGPVRVARELCGELNRMGHQATIFSGARKNSEPNMNATSNEEFVLVRPLLKRYPVSTLWSWKLIPALTRRIKTADVVHIHFARDLIPFLAGILSLIMHKTYVTQTHGMINSDGRLSTKFIDQILTRPILNKSAQNLVLTTIELEAINELGIRTDSRILPNGISIPSNVTKSPLKGIRVAFISRLSKRKGLDKFIELAEKFRDADIAFEIYGPDGGELAWIKTEIRSRNLEDVVSYFGALEISSVSSVLSQINLLVLPSHNEPYPMVVLEALSTGTPVLIMPSCGLAENIRKFEETFVASSETIEGLVESFERQLSSNFHTKSTESIIRYCQTDHALEEIAKDLLLTYEKAKANV